MVNIVYMVWRYLAYNRIKTIILVLSIALIAFLPVGLNILVGQSSESLTARAKSTPLVIGEKGSPLELALNSLYFESKAPSDISFAQADRVKETKLATVIPLYNQFRSKEFPIVGTNIDYFNFRKLAFAEGRAMALLGECVIGKAVAESLGITVGDSIISTPESAFDLAGVYPLKMQVVGIFKSTGTPDDRAIFTDLKTTWVISGLAHGHQDISELKAADKVIKEDRDNIVANASIIEYNEITDENRDSFHFHGDPKDFPITTVIALPHDAKSATLLQGKYLSDTERMQIIRPINVVNELLSTILTIRNYILAGAGLAAGSTIMIATLVFLLSLQLRKREIDTMHRIGVPSHRVVLLLITEILFVLIFAIVVASILALLLTKYGDFLIHNILI